MKLLKVLSLLFVLTVSPVSLQAIKTESQAIVDMDLFLQPLHMTSAGLNFFFEQLYNSHKYTDDFLPIYVAKDIGEILMHGKETHQGPEFFRPAFSLISQKVKRCQYISAYSFVEFLEQLPDLVDYLFSQDNPDKTKKEIIEDLLYQEFYNNFAAFQEEPRQFFSKLADSILIKTDLDAVRASIIRFIELCSSKLLWDPTDKDIWKNISRINNAILKISGKNIITDQDDLNDIAWSIVHRLCYFIDIVKTELPFEVYTTMRDGIPHTHIFNIEEQEQVIETKRHRLEEVILSGIAKKIEQESTVR